MEAVTFAWTAISRDFVGVALPIATALFLSSLPSALLNGMLSGVQTALGAAGSRVAAGVSAVEIISAPILYGVGVVSQAFFLGGIVQFALAVGRGQRPAFAEVFSGSRYFPQLVLGHLLFSLAVIFGLVACIVPGIIIALGCQFYAHFVVDRGLSGVDALKESWQRADGHKMNLFVLALLLFVVFLAGVLACCVGAVLVSLPITVLSTVFVYLRLNGEEPRLPELSAR